MSKIKNINDQLKALFFMVKNYKRLRKLCNYSLLSDEKLLVSCCRVCGSDSISLFVKLPLGIPEFQNHSLLYFSKMTIEKEKLDGKGEEREEKRREEIDSALGFFLSVPWYFCDRCKNATLGINIDEDHLLNYYSKYYKRNNPSDDRRRATKELHGRFLGSLLNKKSVILEIGAAEGLAAEYLADKGHCVYVYEPSSLQENIKENGNLFVVDNVDNLNVKFNVIYLHHVLEHICNPANFLKKTNTLLANNGILFIQVPDFSLQFKLLNKIANKYFIYTLFNHPLFEKVKYNFQDEKAFNWFDSLLNAHVTAFTPEGLRFALESSGYTIEKAIQSTKDTITVNREKYSWPVDETTGNTPNGLTILAKKL